MRTIGKHWPKDAPRGDYIAVCDYCSVKWRRSQLRRTPAGFLACPDDWGDRHYAAARHIPNDDGTGSNIVAPGDRGTDYVPVVL